MKLHPLSQRPMLLQKVINIFPKQFRLKLVPRRYYIDNFVKKSAESLKNNSKVLDAGAGHVLYKEYFSHCSYEATDYKKFTDDIDFVCDLENIPMPNKTYDAIILTEVLEHLKYPSKVLIELNRILKKDGTLFITCPQGWMIHQAPDNYFYFTKYGIALLLKDAGFKNYKIKAMGGYFMFLSDTLKTDYVLRKHPILRTIIFPFNQVLFPLILFYLDRFDKDKLHTIGYMVEARK